MKDNDVTFEKGKNIPLKLLTSNPTSTLFINISSINNKPNKWVNDNNIISNCSYGDVLISLDGTIGLVNNFIKGFNGYAYKVISNKYKNYQLYYSLIHALNKTIINENAIGSVIQHASKSRDYLLLFNFKYDYLLEMIYKYEIAIKLILDKLNKIITMLVDMYLI